MMCLHTACLLSSTLIRLELGGSTKRQTICAGWPQPPFAPSQAYKQLWSENMPEGPPACMAMAGYHSEKKKKIFPVDSKLAVHKPESPVTQGPSHCDTIPASLKGVTLLMVTGNCSWRMKQRLVKYQMMPMTLRRSWEARGETLEFAMTSVSETVTHHASSL